MTARKERCTIEVVVSLVHKVQQRWDKNEFAAALFIDVKACF